MRRRKIREKSNFSCTRDTLVKKKLKFKKLSCNAVIVHLRIKLTNPGVVVDQLDQTMLNLVFFLVFLIELNSLFPLTIGIRAKDGID